MSTKNISEYILLSKLIKKLEDQEYYRTYAKSLLMTNRPEIQTPDDNKVVEEMFRYFIQTDDLKMYHKDSEMSLSGFKNEAKKRNTASKGSIENENLIRKSIWENEIYIKASELKKLYANKCIVLPNSLLKECSEEEI